MPEWLDHFHDFTGVDLDWDTVSGDDDAPEEGWCVREKAVGVR